MRAPFALSKGYAAQTFRSGDQPYPGRAAALRNTIRIDYFVQLADEARFAGLLHQALPYSRVRTLESALRMSSALAAPSHLQWLLVPAEVLGWLCASIRIANRYGAFPTIVGHPAEAKLFHISQPGYSM